MGPEKQRRKHTHPHPGCVQGSWPALVHTQEPEANSDLSSTPALPGPGTGPQGLDLDKTLSPANQAANHKAPLLQPLRRVEVGSLLTDPLWDFPTWKPGSSSCYNNKNKYCRCCSFALTTRSRHPHHTELQAL